MAHMIGFQQSVDQATRAAINFVTPEDILVPSGATRLLVPSTDSFLWWGYAVGPSLTRAEIVAASLGVKRETVEMVPARRGTEVVDIAGVRVWQPARPIPLIPGETIEVDTAEDGAGATQQTAFLVLGPAQRPPMPDGEVRTIRATGTTTLTVRGWTTVPLTPDVTLEPGVYTVVGFIPVSANIVAARLLFPAQGPRPGMLGPAQTAGNPVDIDPAVLWGLMGYTMGSFISTVALPQAQFYSTVADTAETVFLYVIRTGPPPTLG